MKPSYPSEVIISEIENLITYSCQNKSISHENFATFHTALIKKYFGAMTVNLLPKRQQVALKIPIEKNEYVHATVAYKSLESFLKSCIEKDTSSLSFYQRMLSFYNIVHCE